MKRILLEHLFTQGPVLICCDGRRCVMPEHLRGLPALKLMVGRPPYVEISDLSVTEEELTATMTFAALGEVPAYRCILPLTAIYAASVIGSGGALTCSITWWSDCPRDLSECTPAPPNTDGN